MLAVRTPSDCCVTNQKHRIARHPRPRSAEAPLLGTEETRRLTCRVDRISALQTGRLSRAGPPKEALSAAVLEFEKGGLKPTLKHSLKRRRNRGPHKYLGPFVHRMERGQVTHQVR
jgi:hypothetical protein